MTPTLADLAAALETVRTQRRDWFRYDADGKPISYLDDCELLARWLVANADRLRVETDCEMCGGDGVFGFTECAMCDGNGYSLAPAFPTKGEQ